MSTSIPFSQSPISTGSTITVSAAPNMNRSVDSLPSQATSSKTATNKPTRGRKDRPCDACRRRKSKCVMNEGQVVCAACAMHGQKCTFVENPRPRKRRVDPEGQIPDAAKRRWAKWHTNGEYTANTWPRSTAQATKGPKEDLKVKREGSGESSSSATSPGKWQYHGSHVGYTTELEPMLFDISRSAGTASWGANYQKSDDRNAFLTFGGIDKPEQPSTSIQAAERLVGPLGPALLQHFQTSISRSFPIIEDASLAPSNRRSIDPALLCAIYTVSASSPGFQSDKKRHALDIGQLEDLSLSLLGDSLAIPTLSTIQAGLLLMQRSEIDSKTLNTQLVSAAFELGLHLDCVSWSLGDDERGLRKRLAWAVYMQDQWCSLVHGRPSLISKAHWAVQILYDDDFGSIRDASEAALEERKRGQECFCEMVALTEILSSILDTFYTQLAMQEYDAAGENGTRLILERAKPVQMKLKDWFTQLPKTLKLDNGQAPPIIGHLHLAYFATEITLHRCIIRSLAASSSDTYLIHICRSAAKTRLISAMDFVNRLRSDHLTSFWYFPSKVNFALVATFGSLLLATAPCQEEAEFYKARLGEYKWTLSVSAKNAGFLNFALESLESSSYLLKSLPRKPKIEDLDIRQVPPPPLPPLPSSSLPITRLVPPQEITDDEMMDDVAPLHSSHFQTLGFGAGFDMMSPVTESTEPIFFNNNSNNNNEMMTTHRSGPFAGTAFEGLAARNWFDNSHHGSPEAERMELLSG